MTTKKPKLQHLAVDGSTSQPLFREDSGELEGNKLTWALGRVTYRCVHPEDCSRRDWATLHQVRIHNGLFKKKYARPVTVVVPTSVPTFSDEVVIGEAKLYVPVIDNAPSLEEWDSLQRDLRLKALAELEYQQRAEQEGVLVKARKGKFYVMEEDDWVEWTYEGLCDALRLALLVSK